MQVIYKGARDGKDYDNFTYNKQYDAIEDEEFENCGLLIVKNDLGKIVKQPSIDFDFE